MTRNNNWGSRKAPALSIVADAAERWKSMPDGPEKYNAYLCSREWAKLKEAVRERSCGRCERCLDGSAENVHHLTYIRKFQELPEDLQHVCRACHEFLSGKTDLDPKEKWKREKRLSATLGPYTPEEDILLCPVCGFNCSHIKEVFTETDPTADEGCCYDGTIERIATNGYRRSALVVVIDGECGHRWRLVIQQHKGEHFVYQQAGLDGDIPPFDEDDGLSEKMEQARREEFVKANPGHEEWYDRATKHSFEEF